MDDMPGQATDVQRCAVCGDVIGLYERALLELAGEGTRISSLLAEEERRVHVAYHLACAMPAEP
jgi:hypothetical protein